ncbi:MAG TPA: NADH:ubiquinone reductase (Na(+)-transporting) subunit B, partial [Halieaceae bacterium]|nr:NADH:ubiquinone reductase (Na(+)-transporting) subunit B [Halieaceae bacterium]
MGLRNMLDKMAPAFEKGGKYEKMYPLYEAVDTGLFRPSSVTNNTAHVRDGIDLKRIMITVWLCTFPAMFFGMYNIGLQANGAIAAGAGMPIESWREVL